MIKVIKSCLSCLFVVIIILVLLYWVLVLRPTGPAPRPKPTAAPTGQPAPTATPQPPAPAPARPATACGPPVAFPRPAGDNGRGIHWCPSPRHRTDVTDRLVPELERMGIRWVVTVEGIDSWDFEERYRAEDAYFIQALLGRGMMPVVRLSGKVCDEDRQAFIDKMREYRNLGVRYFQVFNEPNRHDEWAGGQALSAREYVALWLPRATAVVEAGGYPGLGSLDPAGGQDDVAFLRDALTELKRVGACGVLTHTWIGVHNYTTRGFDPGRDYLNDTEGFALFKVYDGVVREALGVSLPIISTEGGIPGTRVDDWQRDPAGMEALQAQWTVAAYNYMQSSRPDYYLAFSPWILGNLICDTEGDPAWEYGAFFDRNGTERAVVKVLKGN